ncbi:MAG: ribose-phosphate pyrophosphokinase [Chloroflexi bacterium RBG_16_57_9]|nr:MAG: ribose-phosphate pyrophosphokinase [Chloroflexi bacterium RBG_16_57_9]
MRSMYGELAIFSGTANRPLAQEIADYLGVSLRGADIIQFANTNTFVRLHGSVRSQDVFVVQPTSAPVNDNIMELLIMIDTLKRDSAGRITAVVPYYGYGRTDKKDQPRVPITARLVADMITVAGADRVIFNDLHAGQIQGFFTIPVDDITAFHILRDYFLQKNLGQIAVVAADVGATKRARNMAQALDAPLAIIEKRRQLDGSRATALNLIGDVQGCNCIIIDDEIDTAGTIVQAANFLKHKGAQDVYASVTHPVLSDPATERLREAPFKEIVVTNTIVMPPHKRLPNITTLSVGPLLGEVIRRIHLGISVGEMFNE